MRWLAVGALQVLAALAPTAACYAKRVVTVQDFPLLRDRVSAVQLSPDTGRIAVVDQNSLRILRTSDGGTIKDLGNGFAPRWSPTGSQLAYVSNESGEMQIWLWDSSRDSTKQVSDIAGGMDVDPTTRVAGSLGDAFRLAWSPDGTRIAFTSRLRSSDPEGALWAQQNAVEDANAPLILTNSTPDSWTFAGVFAQPIVGGVAESKDGRTYTFRSPTRSRSTTSQLLVLDLKRGITSRLTSDQRTWFHPSWSPDGKTLLVCAIDDESLRISTTRSQLVLIDTQTKDQRTFLDGPNLLYRPIFSDSGDEIAYLSTTSIMGWPELQIAKVGGRARIERLSFIDRYIYSYLWMDVDRLLVTYKDRTSVRVGMVDRRSRLLTQVGNFDGVSTTVRDVSRAHDGAIAWGQFDPEKLSTVQYLDNESGSRRIVARLNTEADQFELGQTRTVQWKNGRGELLEGILLLPPGYIDGHRYPLVVDAYPLFGTLDWANPMMGNYAWAARGYLVFRLGARAPHVWMNPWTTQSWSAAAKGPDGWNVAMDDLTSGIDELVRQNLVEPDRICLYGFSNGAAVVNNAITRSSRFACAISVSPAISDWVRPLHRTHSSFVESLTGLEFESHIKEYVELSSVFRLSHVTTPLLLAVGDRDASILDALEIYNGLKARGKAVSLMRYPNQGHVFSDEAAADLVQRGTAFLDQYLRRSE